MPVYPPPPSGGSSLTVKDEGAGGGVATVLDFVGAGVSAAVSGGTATVTIAGGTAAGSIVFLDEGAVAGTATHLNVVGAGGTVAYSGGTATLTISGGSGGVDWNQDINESGTAFTNFTAGGGTWASDGTTINQTDTAASWRRSRFNTALRLGFPTIIEAECQIVSGARVGLSITDGSNASGLNVNLEESGDVVNVDRDEFAQVATFSHTIATATWYKIRVVLGGPWATIYIDGSVKGSAFLGNQSGWDGNAQYLTLTSYNASVKFRNIKAWTLSTGAPA